jgi:DNA-directed RNA polymerase specialized sigma24 family protein
MYLYLKTRNPEGEEPKKPPFNLEKLQEIREKQVILDKVKFLRFFEHLSDEEIAEQLNKPIKMIKEVIKAFEEGTKAEYLKAQTAILFDNKQSPEEIAKLLRFPKQKVEAWLQELGLLKVSASSAPTISERKKAEAVIRKAHPRGIKAQVIQFCQDTDMSYADISKMTGIPRTTINKWCKKDSGKVRRVKPSAEQKAQALALIKEGKLSHKKIAKIVGVSSRTIDKWAAHET